MGTKSSSINLLKKRSGGAVDRFIDWALSIGKYVVIITETIALTAFLYRFSLDRQLIDLHEDIKSNQVLLTIQKSNEERYRNLQTRLKFAKELGSIGNDTTKLFTDLYSIAPIDVLFNKMSLSQRDLTIEADTPSVTSLAEFITKLREHKDIESVSIDKIENKTSSAIITVGISAVIKKRAAQN